MSLRVRLRRPHRLTGWAAIVPVAAAGAGLMFAASAQTSQGTELRSSGRSDLVDVVRAQDRAVHQKAVLVKQIQDEVDALTAQAAPGDAAVARLRAEAAGLAPSVGTQSVTGPALIVSLDDSKRSLASLPKSRNFTADDLVIHQQDVQNVVNALWAGGAEAMMLQDQRVISTSAVRCVGNTLILQGRVYSPPYVIQAIGSTSAMRDALNRSPEITTYKEYVDAVGLGYDVTSKGTASFPAYAGSLSLLYATALK